MTAKIDQELTRIKAQKLLPDWIGEAQNLDEISQNSIALIDEAYLAITPEKA